MKRSLPALRAACVVLSLAAVTVSARSAHAEADPMTARAASLYDEAMVAFDAKKWSEARASLLAAWALKRHWQIAGSLAQAEMKLGLFRDAAGHLAFFLRHAPPEQRTEPMLALSAAARANVGTLTLKLEGRGVDVRVDGDSVGTTPLEEPVFVDPGNHRIEAREGSRAASADVDVVAGDRREVALTLKSLDLYHAAAPPASPAPLAPRAEHGDGASSAPGMPWIIASGALGVLGLGLGTGLTVAANTKASEAATDRALVGGSSACVHPPASSSCAALSSAVTNKDALSNGAVGAFVVGGTFAVTAIALGAWQLAAPRASSASSSSTASSTATGGTGSTLAVLPSLGREGGGITLRAAW